MKPNGGGAKLPGRLEKKITEDLGGLENSRRFRRRRRRPVRFRLGMVVGEERQARNLQDPQRRKPLVHGAAPILGVDVWEHSITSIIAIAARII